MSISGPRKASIIDRYPLPGFSVGMVACRIVRMFVGPVAEYPAVYTDIGIFNDLGHEEAGFIAGHWRVSVCILPVARPLLYSNASSKSQERFFSAASTPFTPSP